MKIHLCRCAFLCAFVFLSFLSSTGCGDQALKDLGTKGGACFANTACNIGLTCEKGVCVECADGKLGCACDQSGKCDQGLACQAGVDLCISQLDCVPGSADCPCLAGQCNPGLTCSPQGLCLECTNDVAGCPCDDGFCGGGLSCQDGLCYLPADAPLRVLDTCYSPCRDDIRLTDGTLVRCSAEGLFQGCLPGTDCIGGSCVADTRPRACADDVECPDFQMCVEGECRSTCEGDNDCRRGTECYRHVCRVPCASDADCPDHDFCKVVDTSAGYCMPLRPENQQSQRGLNSDPDAIVTDGQPEHLEITAMEDSVMLNPARQSAEILLLNTGDHKTTFSVQKAEHFETKPDGRVVRFERGDQIPPLTWLKLGFAATEEGDITANTDDNLEATLEHGQTGRLKVQISGDMPRQWQGTVEIVAKDTQDRIATQRISIVFAERPEGRWEGDAIYFSSFDVTGLEEWLAGGRNPDNDDELNNALLRRWRDFVRYQTGVSAGRVDYDELTALLTATRDETWRHRSVQDICPKDQDSNELNDPVCYLSGNSQGYTLYTENRQRYPVPFGGISFPMALHLADSGDRQPDDGIDYLGRIDSASTMHYAANPSATLVFSKDPTDCTASDGRSCVVPLKAFSSDIVVPGRFTDEFGTGCKLPDTIGDIAKFDPVITPWLVPGFPSGAEFNSQKAQWERTECAGSDAPYAFDEGANRRLAQANPIPDARPRVRRIELIDGALIDGHRLIIIFREEMGSLLVPGEKTYNYGLMDLRKRGVRLEADEFVGNEHAWTEIDDDSAVTATYVCRDELRELFSDRNGDSIERDVWQSMGDWGTDELTRDLAKEVASVMLTGRAITVSATPFDAQNVHWMCRGPDVSLRQFNQSGQQSGNTSARIVGYFNQGGPDRNDACPESHELRYFAIDGVPRFALNAHTCNSDGSCHLVFDEWISGVRQTDTVLAGSGRTVDDVVFDPISDCESNGSVTAAECTPDRQNPLIKSPRNLTTGAAAVFKEFYKPQDGGVQFEPLRNQIRKAFRYRTEFLGRDGTPLGFPPEICAEDLNQTPFCYDPELIEQVRDRVDCLLAVYHHHRDEFWNASPHDDLALRVRDYLIENFSSRVEFHPLGNPNLPVCVPGGSNAACLPVEYMGFERLYAELMILLGDEAFTQSVASRFDLAGIRNRAFDGRGFEGPDGLELSGGVGYEMHLLYQATQYYTMVIDRFARLSRAIGEAAIDQRGKKINSCGDQCTELVDAVERADWSFLSQATVTIYMDRLVRASTQKAKAVNRISKSYQNLNEPDLARQVIDRAYPGAYMEFLLLTRLLDSIIDVTSITARAQLEMIQTNASLRYRTALSDMRTTYAEISDDVTLFGFAPEYVPIPVLTAGQANSFERMYEIAYEQMQIAADKEQIALVSDRSSRTGIAEFRSELSDIRTEYETQLGELCGYVEGKLDGKLYPALARYAHLFRDAEALQGFSNSGLSVAFQSPCGRFGSGDLFEALSERIEAQLSYKQARAAYQNTLKEIDAEKQRTQRICKEDFDFSTDAAWSAADGQATSLSDEIDDFSTALSAADLTYTIGNTVVASKRECDGAILEAATAEPTGMAAAGAAAANTCGFAAAQGIADVAHISTTFGLNKKIESLQGSLDEAQSTMAVREEILKNCRGAEADLGPKIRKLIGDTLTQQIEILRKAQELELRTARIKRLRNQQNILEAEYDEKSQLAIDAAAAANDPNVRIYQNDEILTADRTFYRAVRSAYKATKVYEYFTGQSFEDFNKLLLSRTVLYGDYSLEAYLEALEDAYIAHQETYGAPDLRVMIKSLREDIFHTDLYGDNGEALSQAVRDAKFRAKLKDKNLLNEQSYIVQKFRIDRDEISPLTHNHKIDHIRAEIVYDGSTDVLARVYVRPTGTAMVVTDYSDPIFYRMTPQVAVINPTFNGAFLQQAQGAVTSDDLVDDIFVSGRLRDRPLLNTQWEIVLNVVDEQVNKDLLLDQIKDIRLFFYYTDFTVLPD